MTTSKLYFVTSAMLFSVLSMSAFGQEDVEIEFQANFGNDRFSCGQRYEGVGTTLSTVTPSDYRLFVYDVSLIDSSGELEPLELVQDNIWQYQNIALLDFEDGSGPCLNGNSPTNTSIKGQVKKGDYTGVQFSLGLPYELNHENVTTASSPLNLSAMFWNWRGGHRFLKVDMSTTGRPVLDKPASGVRETEKQRRERESSGFSMHIGSTGCASISRTMPPEEKCANPNQVQVIFEDFNPDQHVVIADAMAVLTNTNVDVNTTDTAPGCMSGQQDPECGGILKAFGFTTESSSSAQQFFRAEAK